MDRVLDRLRRLTCRVDDYTSSLKVPSAQSLATDYQKEESPLASMQTSCLSKCPVSTTSFVPNDELKKDLKKPTSESEQTLQKGGGLQTKNHDISAKALLSMPVKCPSGKSNDIVVNCDPSSPPLSLFILLDALSSLRSFHIDTLVHSSLKLPSQKLEGLKKIFQLGDQHQGVPFSEEPDTQRITVIWKDMGGVANSSMSVGLNMHILGEKSIAKHLFHLMEVAVSKCDVKPVFQNPSDTVHLTIAEDIIDSCQDQRKTKDMVTKLQSALRASSGPLLFGAFVSLADTISWSTLLQSSSCNASVEIQSWFKYCSHLPNFSLAIKMLETCPK